jgi:hypothetical protein
MLLGAVLRGLVQRLCALLVTVLPFRVYERGRVLIFSGVCQSQLQLGSGESNSITFLTSLISKN